jgi:hypothetical protein
MNFFYLSTPFALKKPLLESLEIPTDCAEEIFQSAADFKVKRGLEILDRQEWFIDTVITLLF